MKPAVEAVKRFAADLDALVPPGERIGVAVSGGPDSLALLLLAAAARPGLIEVATVDHALRPESLDEAEMVAGFCDRLDIPHAILTVEWEMLPTSQLQAVAGFHRYRLLGEWADAHRLACVATAHHLDDQAETVLMRLNRGSGVRGLAAIRPSRPLTNDTCLIRPLIGWRRLELAQICAQADVRPVADPSNDDPRFTRTHARALLASSGWLDPEQISQSASHVADAEEALEWLADRLVEERVRRVGDEITIDARDLPVEMQRRLLSAAHEMAGSKSLRGPDLRRAILSLNAGGSCTLGKLKMVGEPIWRLALAPSRRA